jgi:CRP/FNR family transcriptional regulator, anaerobic regulatory protein
MDQEQIRHILSKRFSDQDLIDDIIRFGEIKVFETGQMVIKPGQFLKIIPLILEGSLKIIRTEDAGHELFLYYLEQGQTCAVSLTCCNSDQKSMIKAVAEEPTTLIAIPTEKHNEWHHAYRQWKEFVTGTYQQRFHELIAVIDQVAFKKLDDRLLNYLIMRSKQHNTLELQITHKEIANELSSSREVISRLLKVLENRKLVALERNMIILRADLEEKLN